MIKAVIFGLAVVFGAVSADEVSVCLQSGSGAYLSASSASSVTGVSTCGENEKWTIFEDGPFSMITHDALSAGLQSGHYYYLSGYVGGTVDLTADYEYSLDRYQSWQKQTNTDGTVSYANYEFTPYPWAQKQIPPSSGPAYLTVSSGSAGLADTIGTSEKF